MDSAFIGQAYDIASSSASELLGSETDITSTGDAVRESLSDPRFDEAVLCVAFASSKGVKHLDSLAHNAAAETLQLIVGVDEGVTSKDALEQLLEREIDSRVYRAFGITYHPKVYFFEGDDRARVIVGSSNLTEKGLYNNFEISTIIDLDTSDPQDQLVLTDIQRSLLEPLAEDSEQLTSELIEKLEQDGLIESEAEQRKRRAESERQSRNSNDESEGAEPFGVKISPQSVPSLSTSRSNTRTNQSRTENRTIDNPPIEELPSRNEMPSFPKVTEFKTATDAEYYGQLTSKNENQVNYMRRIIRERGEMTKGELKEYIRTQLGTNISGSFNADLRVLWRSTGEVETEGRGDSQVLTWVGK